MAEHEQYFASESQLRAFKIKKILRTILLYGFLIILGMFIVLPFYYMMITSFKGSIAFENEEISGKLVLYLNKTNFSTEQFAKVLGGKHSFTDFYLNTLYVSVISTLFTLITTVLASFAFARVDFKGKDFIFALLLSTMMVPGEMMMMTNYQTTVQLNWANTFAALIFVHGVSVFYIFYLRQTFQQIPNELFLAAKVDGYGHFQYLWKCMIPIASPTIITILILSLMGAWNAYIWPTLIASGNNVFLEETFNIKHSMLLVSNGLMSKFTSEFQNDVPARICGSLFATVPLFVFFLIFRKYIMRGVSRSGIKG